MEEVPLMAIVRIRGRVDVKPDIKHTMDMLHIRRKYWATVVPFTPSYKGMLHKVKDYTTYGEIDRETLLELLLARGELTTGGRLTDEWLNEHREETGFSNVQELVDALMEGRAKLHKLRWLKPYFRLHPPKGGFKRTTKRAWNDGGELGYRGKEINKLIRRMI